jgi:hypothetical protein
MTGLSFTGSTLFTDNNYSHKHSQTIIFDLYQLAGDTESI